MTKKTPVALAWERGLWTAHEAAAYLGRSRWTIYEMVKQKTLKAVKLGKRIFFRPTDLQTWVRKLK